MISMPIQRTVYVYLYLYLYLFIYYLYPNTCGRERREANVAVLRAKNQQQASLYNLSAWVSKEQALSNPWTILLVMRFPTTSGSA